MEYYVVVGITENGELQIIRADTPEKRNEVQARMIEVGYKYTILRSRSPIISM